MTTVDTLSFASPERISDFLGHGVSSDLVQRILAAPPLRQHLSRLLTARLGGDASSCAVKVALSLDLADVTTLATRAGVVWNASLICGVIGAGARRDLIAEIGDDQYELALAARQASIAVPEVKADLESLGSAFAQEGTSCLTAWRDRQPQQIAAHLQLYWPSAEVTETHRKFGPVIVDWLLSRPSD